MFELLSNIFWGCKHLRECEFGEGCIPPKPVRHCNIYRNWNSEKEVL